MITSSEELNSLLRDREACSACQDNRLILLYDFGARPLAGYFPFPGEASEIYQKPMKLYRCNSCGLVQISPDISDLELFSNYRYMSKFSMSAHFQELAIFIKKLNLDSSARILEVGCNDGTLMNFLRENQMNVIGVDPAVNIVQRARDNGHEVFPEFFSKRFVEKQEFRSCYDLIISCNSFAHISNIRDVVEGISIALKESGRLLVEVQSLPKLVEDGSFDFVYHEHKYYYDLESIQNLVKPFGLFLEFVSPIEIHGGSYRLIFRKNGNVRKAREIVMSESRISNSKIRFSIQQFIRVLEILGEKIQSDFISGKRFVAFGAAGRGNLLLSYMGVNSCIRYVYDESPERIGRLMALSGIEVKNFKEINEFEYDECVVLAWNFFDSIIAKWPHKKKTLIKPLPTPERFQVN